jgi:trigger factor
VRLEIEVPFAELEPSLRKAYREIGAQANIPGFRKGKVPPSVIDQRIGRGTVLTEAVQDVIPTQILAAVREHEVKTLGRPDVEITEFGDGQPLKFTAEVDVRPQIRLPDLSSIEVSIEPLTLSDAEIDAQVSGLQERFATLKTVERSALVGDFVQVDLAANVDGEEVPGGSATNVSHEVGSGRLVPGLDDVLVGMAAGDATTFTTQLVGGDQAGKDAEVAVTVRTVKEKQMPELDDSFAQLASEFDTLAELRADLSERLTRVKRLEQLYGARDKALKALIDATDVPAPDGIVREEVEQRKASMAEQLDRMGATLADYLETEGKSEEDMETELTEAAAEGVKIQLVLDTLADAEQLTVTDDEFGHEIVHRAQRAGVNPQQYYDELIKAGAAGAIFGDVRRGKALALVLERVTILDADGNRISLEDLRGSEDEAHDHDDHEGHDH